MLLDRAPEVVKIFDTKWVDDGYGAGQSPVAAETAKEYKAFILPTGFAGAGWAINMRFAGQGWADAARITVIIKWTPALDEVRQWTRLEAQGQTWTVVQAPRQWRTRRIRYVWLLAELKGDAE
ncbi:hypothetical protein [Nonomuraea sp. NPDC049129]|uniref:hypothetical protein n=1 Tax=Nonomuraea sp. NPDC049129 TaxID=3155272 RepID=UPI0033C3CCAC